MFSKGVIHISEMIILYWSARWHMILSWYEERYAWVWRRYGAVDKNTCWI